MRILKGHSNSAWCQYAAFTSLKMNGFISVISNKVGQITSLENQFKVLLSRVLSNCSKPMNSSQCRKNHLPNKNSCSKGKICVQGNQYKLWRGTPLESWDGGVDLLLHPPTVVQKGELHTARKLLRDSAISLPLAGLTITTMQSEYTGATAGSKVTALSLVIDWQHCANKCHWQCKSNRGPAGRHESIITTAPNILPTITNWTESFFFFVINKSKQQQQYSKQHKQCSNTNHYADNRDTQCSVVLGWDHKHGSLTSFQHEQEPIFGWIYYLGHGPVWPGSK